MAAKKNKDNRTKIVDGLAEENRQLQSEIQTYKELLALTEQTNWTLDMLAKALQQRNDQLKKENKRLLACMNRGATAMMDYPNSFKN